MKILIAEDNSDNRDMLKRRLQRKGYEVCAVTDGEQAVEAVTTFGPHLVLMDISMPVMSGLEATAKIRAAENGQPRTPIIALTAHAMETDRDQCLRAGCDAFATKPLEFPALLALIERFAGDEP